MGQVFLSGIVLGDVGQFSDADMEGVVADCQRALISRLRPLPSQLISYFESPRLTF